MDDPLEDAQPLSQDPIPETPPSQVFIPPSIHTSSIQAGASYTHFSPIPPALAHTETECVLGIDEAGRGPVLGPMVYGVFYCPKPLETPLLKDTHRFDDSKALTPDVRHALMQTLCTPGTDLASACGFGVRVMSARDIGAGMLRPGAPYNLNAQAMDATVALIRDVLAAGVRVSDIFIDTIGAPARYQAKLERIFPTVRIVVATKADALYPCVSAASVCAKVTRDAALEVCAEMYGEEGAGWGSGYPSDARCTAWMKGSKDPVFGWGAECRFSWSTATEMLEGKSAVPKVVWPAEGDEGANLSRFFVDGPREDADDGMPAFASWFGKSVTEHVF